MNSALLQVLERIPPAVFHDAGIAKSDALAEASRLRAIEDATRWHYANSACAGWMQGEVLALALNLDPDGPKRQFRQLLKALNIDPREAEIPDWGVGS